MIERPESLYFGWLLIAAGAAIILLRHRLAVYQRQMGSLRRRSGPTFSHPGDGHALGADPLLGRAILAAIGVLLMFTGLLLIAGEPILWLLGLR